MLAARHLRSAEARANLEGLGGGDGEHSMAQFGLELVENGFTKTGRNVTDDTGNGSTDGILSLLSLDNALQALFNISCLVMNGVKNVTLVIFSLVSG